MPSVSERENDYSQPDWASSKWSYRASGALAALLGILAIVFPVAASIGFELLLGAILVAYGLVELARVFWVRGTGHILANLLVGLLAIATGLLLLAFPMQGVLSLTILFGAFFMAIGSLKLIYAFQERQGPGWTWGALSGALSVALGVLLVTALPGAALWAIGMLVGIDLIFFGATQFAIARQIARLRD